MTTDLDDALRLSLEIWHPDCWTTETTQRIDVGILSHGVYRTGNDRATSLCTFYADEQTTIDEALSLIKESPHIYSVAEMRLGYGNTTAASPGNATRELLVEQDGGTQITEAFSSHGFVYVEPVDGNDGLEHWTLLTNHDRDRVRAVLDTIREEKGAEITVRTITNASTDVGGERIALHTLSRRQREVFHLARDRGYYDWPKGCSAKELAAELEIATSTLHEHLHKVEAKLLGSLSE